MHKESLSQMYREYQGKGGEGSNLGLSTPIRTISGVREAVTAGRQEYVEVRDATSACIVGDDNVEYSTQEKEMKPTTECEQQSHLAPNEGKKSEEENGQKTPELNRALGLDLSLQKEAVESGDTEITTGIAEAIEDSPSKTKGLVEETADVDGASPATQTILEEMLESPEILEKSTPEVEEEDDFVDLKEESSLPLPSEESVSTGNEEHSNLDNESQVTLAAEQETISEKKPESTPLESEGAEGRDETKQELASVSEMRSSQIQEVTTQLSSEPNETEDEKTLASETKVTGEDGNTLTSEVCMPSEKKIAKLDVSSVASDTERLELKASTSLEATQSHRPLPEVTFLHISLIPNFKAPYPQNRSNSL